MQFLTINNQNFEKSSRILSNRRTSYQKNCFDTSEQKIGSACAQSPRKCSNIGILAKIEGKESKFISKVDQGHIRFGFRSKKFKIISCLCNFNRVRQYILRTNTTTQVPTFRFYFPPSASRKLLIVITE